MEKTISASVKDLLKALYELQLIDSKIDEIQILKGELPIEVSELNDEIEGLDTRVNRLNESVDKINSDIGKHDLNIQQSKMLIERYEKQLNEVKNNREYDALQKEIELQKLEIQLSEKKIKESKDQLENKNLTLSATVEKRDGRLEDLQRKKVELDKILTNTEKEEKKLKKASLAAEKNIDSRLLTFYHKVRNRYRNGLAVVTINRDACGGCYNRIPPQMKIEMGLFKEVVVCEHCGRIIISPGFAAEIDGSGS